MLYLRSMLRKVFQLAAACILVLLPLCAMPVFAAAAPAHVAVLETIQMSKDLLTIQELRRLTDELRAQALRVLPPERNFTIMTRENINAMLPPGKSVEQCEGSCLVETGRNINAEYIAQGRVSLFGKRLSLTVELYETLGSKLLGTFSSEGGNAEDLLLEIKKNSPGLFGKVPGALVFGSAYSGASGISGLNSGTGYFASFGANKYIVTVFTAPGGALLSVDGIPVPSCKGTPCKVEMTEGAHRVIASLDLYRVSDTTISAERNEQQVQIQLVPDFGMLNLYPRLLDGVGEERDLSVLIDGSNSFSIGDIKLSPGPHSVKISHPCYEDYSFEANIEVNETMDFDSLLVSKNGGVELRAERDGEPQSVPVWRNGDSVGVTPWRGTVPVCASLAIGAEQEPVHIVEYRKNTSYVYEMPSSYVREREHTGDAREFGYDYSEASSNSRERADDNYSSSSSFGADSKAVNVSREVNTGVIISPWLEGAAGIERPLGRISRKYDIEQDSMVVIPDFAFALRLGYQGSKYSFFVGGGLMFFGAMGIHVDSTSYYNTTSENVWIYEWAIAPLGQVELRVLEESSPSDTIPGDVAYGFRGSAVFPVAEQEDGYWALYRLGGFLAIGNPVLYVGIEAGGECAWRRGGGVYFSLFFEH